MTRRRAAALILALMAMLMTACGQAPGKDPAITPSTAEPSASAAPEPESGWHSEGRAYRQTPMESGADSSSDMFGLGGDYYILAMYFGVDAPSEIVLLKNGEPFYERENSRINLACAGNDCIWLLEERSEGENTERVLNCLSPAGESLSEYDIGELGLGEAYFSSMRASDEGVWLLSQGEAVLISGGELAADLRYAGDDVRLAKCGDGRVCAVSYTDAGAEVSALGKAGAEPLFALESPGALVLDGSDEFFLTCAAEDGLYALDETGGRETVIVWEDCGVEHQGLRAAAPLSGGRFLMRSAIGLSMLTPAEPSEMHTDGELTIATISGSLYDLTARFNLSGSGFTLTELDYTQGGELSAQDALTRLYADIAAGKGPDMFLLTDMPVYSLIRRGYLADIAELAEADPGFDVDDIVLADKLGEEGIYFLTGSFGIETYAGLRSNFGDKLGWTLEEYLEAEESLAQGAEMMYNVTRESFLSTTALKYMQKAIDWQSGTCDFDNPEFIGLLEAACRLTEYPEPEEFAGYTPPEEVLRSGGSYVEFVFVGCVCRMSDFEENVGQAVSFVGMPTPDGSCGSVFSLNNPIAVFAGSSRKEGCWEFLKFLLLKYDTSANTYDRNSSMPMYRPYLERQIADAMADERLTQEGADRLYELIGATTDSTICDETALGIICEEAGACFTGARTPEETARIIQERVSIYVSEQA